MPPWGDDAALDRRMRDEPHRLRFEIEARDGAARAGVLHTAHGPVETPAFIPLATKGTVRGLESAEVAGLGYELILGNTYHLFVSPGPERIAAAGGLHGFMGWERALITDSGGFQVFSLAHGGVADEVKGSGRPGAASTARSSRSRRRASASAPTATAPSSSSRPRSRCRCRRRSAATSPWSSTSARPTTPTATTPRARWSAPTAGSSAASTGTARRGPERQAVFGIVQGGVHEDLRRESAQAVSEAGVDGIAIGGTLGRDKEEMAGVLAMTAPLLPAEAPKHLLGIGEVDDLLTGIGLGLDVFDCAVPTRLARHGSALVPDPERRFRLDLRKAGWEGDREPLVEGCPCPACTSHDRDYLSYLSRAEELTAVRLLCLHNLTYMRALVAGARGGDRRRRVRRLPGADPRRRLALRR